MCWLNFLKISVYLSFFLQLNSCMVVYKRKKIVQHGDLMIGALIPVHEQPSYKENDQISISRRKCGNIRDQYGIQRVEALLYMLDIVNNKNVTQLLPGIQLGLEIRDECWDSSIALEETIDFIKDTIASDDDGFSELDNSRQSNSSVKNVNIIPVYGSGNLNEKCGVNIGSILTKDKGSRIQAIIGPGSSTISINVQNLLQLFDITHVGYSATSKDLSDKKMFKTFLRVVPSDYLQVKAMIDLVVKMNWTYLFAIYTEGSYGQGGMEAFRNETSFLNICLALYEKLQLYASQEDYETIVRKMNQTATSARVIVCFCYGETVRGLLGAIKNLGLTGRFLILGSDGWSDRIDVAEDYYEEAVGSISFKAYSPLVTAFDQYFTRLNPSNNLRNVWFNEYWEDRFKCYIDPISIAKYETPCKRKCPNGFIQVKESCYWFPNKTMTWPQAQFECKKRHSNTDLMDINSSEDLFYLIKYLKRAVSKNFFKFNHDLLNEMHVRLKVDGINEIDDENHDYRNSNAQPDDNVKEQETFEDEIDSSSHNIKLKICKQSTSENFTIKKTWRKFFRRRFVDNNFENEFFTIYNSKINQEMQNISIVIKHDDFDSDDSGNEDYDSKTCGFRYCVDLKHYEKKLPFVCKYSGIYIKSIKKHKMIDFFPDTLHNYQQDPKMSYVINSLLAIVHGLDRIHKDWCNGKAGLCDRMKKLNGTELLRNIRESQFLGITNEKIYFDSNGDPPGHYVILNVQKHVDPNDSNNVNYFYRQVGSWNTNSKLHLDLDAIKFSINSSKNSLKSICSEQCSFGHVKQINKGGLKCCWKCKKCEVHSYVLDEHTCQECDLGYWPNQNLTGCAKLPLIYLKWNEPAAVFALIVSSIGIILNTFITQTFIKYSNTCIVKSTTRELSFIIFTGVYLSYFMSIPLVLKPTIVTCYLSRIMPGLSLSLIYGSLITKTNRISRILSRSKKRVFSKKLRFVSLTAQIFITLIMISIECILILAAILWDFTHEIVIVRYPQRNVARLECYDSFSSILGPLGYNMILVGLCTLYAIRTRNLPENFNEAKFIGFAMYTTCVIWTAFVPLYFGSDFKVITLCLSTSFSATVILIFLFIPKVYIILFKPEKNQRSSFATSKELRCHFGGGSLRNKNGKETTGTSSGSNSVSLVFQSKSTLKLKKLSTITYLNKKLSLNDSQEENSLMILKNKNYLVSKKFTQKRHSLPNLRSLNDFRSIKTDSSLKMHEKSCQTSMELLDLTLSSTKKTLNFKSVSFADENDKWIEEV